MHFFLQSVSLHQAQVYRDVLFACTSIMLFRIYLIFQIFLSCFLFKMCICLTFQKAWGVDTGDSSKDISDPDSNWCVFGLASNRWRPHCYSWISFHIVPPFFSQDPFSFSFVEPTAWFAKKYILFVTSHSPSYVLFTFSTIEAKVWAMA